MDWRDKLRDASFRGAPFQVDSHSSEAAGRRVQVHEYPERDEPFAEDLGLKRREFTIQGYVIEPDYMAKRDAVIDACAQPGAGTLVHPYLGSLNVMCADCRVSETSKEGRMARFSFKFLDAGQNRFPAAQTDTAAAVSARSTDAISAARQGFAKIFSVKGLPSFVTSSASNVIGSFSSKMLSAIGGGLTTSLKLKAGAIVSNALSLMASPTDLASSITDLVGEATGVVKTPAQASKFISDLSAFGSEFAAIPLSTSTRTRESKNRDAIISLVKRSSLIETARAAPTMSFASQSEAFGLRDELTDLFDTEQDAASVAGDDPVFNALGALRTQFVKDINARAPELAKVLNLNLNQSEPALVASYRLYGDLSGADEIAARNQIRHPGFLPGGVALEVLSDV